MAGILQPFASSNSGDVGCGAGTYAEAHGLLQGSVEQTTGLFLGDVGRFSGFIPEITGGFPGGLLKAVGGVSHFFITIGIVIHSWIELRVFAVTTLTLLSGAAGWVCVSILTAGGKSPKRGF